MNDAVPGSVVRGNQLGGDHAFKFVSRPDAGQSCNGRAVLAIARRLIRVLEQK